MNGPERLTAWVRGQVQGVGYRWWTRARALELGLVGIARNLSDGRVEVVAEGPRPALDLFLARLADGPGRPVGVVHRFGPARGGLTGFRES